MKLAERVNLLLASRDKAFEDTDLSTNINRGNGSGRRPHERLSEDSIAVSIETARDFSGVGLVQRVGSLRGAITDGISEYTDSLLRFNCLEENETKNTNHRRSSSCSSSTSSSRTGSGIGSPLSPQSNTLWRSSSKKLIVLAAVCMVIGALLNRHMAPLTLAASSRELTALAEARAEERINAEARAHDVAHTGRQAEARVHRKAGEAAEAEVRAPDFTDAATGKPGQAEGSVPSELLTSKEALGAVKEADEPAFVETLLGADNVAASSARGKRDRWLRTSDALIKAPGTESVSVTAKRLPQQVLDGHGKTHALAWAPEGNALATASRDNSVRLWNVEEDGTVDTTTAQVLRGHTDWVWSVAFSPDGRSLASGSDDKSVIVWVIEQDGTVNAAARQLLRGHSEPVRSVAWSPDGSRLASASWDNTVRVWHVDKEGKVSEEAPEVLLGHTGWLYSVAWSPDGKLLASGSWGSFVHLWSLKEDGLMHSGNPQVLNGHKSQVNSVAWAPEHRCLASVSDDGTTRVWAVGEDGDSIGVQVLGGHGDIVNGVAWSPDGRTLSTASADKTVMLWNVTDEGGGKCQIDAENPTVLRGHRDWVISVAYDSYSHRLASASADQALRIWQLGDHSPWRCC